MLCDFRRTFKYFNIGDSETDSRTKILMNQSHLSPFNQILIVEGGWLSL